MSTASPVPSVTATASATRGSVIPRSRVRSSSTYQAGHRNFGRLAVLSMRFSALSIIVRDQSQLETSWSDLEVTPSFIFSLNGAT